MSIRTAIYARYSSDLQREESIEDQVRLASEYAAGNGWDVVNCYTDAGISGTSLLRPGIQALMQAAMEGQVDVVLAEALDRLSRDQEDIAGFYKRMEFAGVKIVTLSEGEIGPLQIGLKGTMNEMYSKDLGDKTRRGQRGLIEAGKSAGGLAYGYRVVKRLSANGEPIKGEREIDEEQAAIVRRIFHEYAFENKSPRSIASDLNKENIPCPSGRPWGQSTINGNRKRGTGILNNKMYIGERIWNRQRFIKNPVTDKRVPRSNPESEWTRAEIPELRIVSEELWNAAKERQRILDKKSGPLGAYKRPSYLLSGLLSCGVCGASYSKINSERYGCSAARNKGESVCNNKKTIKREVLENAVLAALQNRLMRPELVEVFSQEYTKHINALRAAHSAEQAQGKAQIAKLEKQKANIIQAIKEGIPATAVKDELEKISLKLEELESQNSQQGIESKPFIHPAMAKRYSQAITQLTKDLESNQGAQAKEYIRALIEKIVLTPKTDSEELAIDLHGDLAGILKVSNGELFMKGKAVNEKRLKAAHEKNMNCFEPSVQLVAGARFELTTFGL